MGYCRSITYAQRRINIVLQRHKTYAKAYIDNIVMFLTILKEHLKHLQAVFKLFVKHNVTLNPNKAYLGYLLITLLG